ncbi:MAG: hypothetical protein ACJ8FY_05005 [Gemmataceae bacterium]
MSTNAALPSSLQSKLDSLARYMRALRALRGACWLLLLLSLVAGAAVLADAWLELPSAVRVALLATWLGLGIGAAVLGLIVPLVRRLENATLAAMIEDRYPELLERLTSTVELTGPVDIHHGSSRFIDFLVKETDRQTSPLDFVHAVPNRKTGRLALSSLLAVSALLVPAVLWPERSSELAGRFLLPWRDSAAGPTFALAVVPGNTFVGRGQPVTISVDVHAENENVERPRTCRFVFTKNGEKKSLRMEAERSDRFSLKVPRDLIVNDFDYFLEAGPVASSTYHVEVIEPVAMAADSPKLKITSPAYAQATIEGQRQVGLVDLTVLQHSEVVFDCQFTRPALAAYLEWTPETGSKQILPLQLSEDRGKGQIALAVRSNGAYRLVLEAEHGIRTDLPLHRIETKMDLPPVFDKVSGNNELKMVRAYEPIPVEMTLLDDVGVDAAFVEFTVNGGPAQSEAIVLQGKGTREAAGRHLLSLVNKVQEGDEVRYRLKAVDNRRVPEVNLEPNVAYYPEKSWRILKVARQADPLFQQEIEAQRDAIAKKLEAIKENLKKVERSVYKLRQESKDQTALRPEQSKDLQDASRDNRTIEDALRDLSQETGETQGLEHLADLAQDIADKEMRQSADALRDAGKETKEERRDGKFEKSEQQLNSALQKLEALKDANQRLAQQRLDQKKLEMAAERERQLAQKAAELAKKKDADPANSEQIKREQKEVADEVKQLAEKSEALRNALDAARAEESKSLSDKARALAQAERDLDQAIRDREKDQLKGKLDDLARKQEKLAEKAERLAQESKKTLEKPKAKSFHPEEAKKATQSLKEDEPAEAMKHQDQSAKDLDKLAADLEKARNEARASKDVAKQLAQQQKDLLNKTDDKQAKKDPKALPALEQEQRALEKAVKEMPVPSNNQDAQQYHKRAREKAQSAAEQLKNKDEAKARDQMGKARQALDKLGENLPQKSSPAQAKDNPKGQPGDTEKQQRGQAQQLAKEQRELREAVAKTAAEAAKADDKPRDNPLGEIAKQQQEVAQKAGELAKGVEKEQGTKAGPTQQAQKAAQSAKQASNHAQAGVPQKAQEAGKQTAQELHQLAQQLEQTPANPDSTAPDTAQQARQLAKKQDDINRRMEPLGNDKAAQQAQQQARQQDLKEQTGDLTRKLQDLAHQMNRSKEAKENAQQAAGSAQKGQNSMELAQEQGKQGQSEPARDSRQQAAQALDKSAQQASQAAQRMEASQTAQQRSPNSQQAGQSLQQAQNQMNQAQGQLGKGEKQQAQTSMSQAAQNLQQAAQQLAKQQQQQRQEGKPEGGADPAKSASNTAGQVDQALLPADMKKYAGKRWGDLPGELRTQIIQDMKAKYGDSHARMIKLYFEQVGERKGGGSGE